MYMTGNMTDVSRYLKLLHDTETVTLYSHQLQFCYLVLQGQLLKQRCLYGHQSHFLNGMSTKSLVHLVLQSQLNKKRWRRS